MNLSEAKKIVEGDVVVHLYRGGGFRAMMVRDICQPILSWNVDVIDVKDGHITIGKCSFSYGHATGYSKVGCRNEFLRLYKIMQMQEIVTRNLVEGILSRTKNQSDERTEESL